MGLNLCIGPTSLHLLSFVTHSARATADQLAKADLLPKIRFKILLTPELSTIFRGKPDELAERFSIITRVLDGQGLTTDSGTHGRRGYTGDYLFAWIGGTTPFHDTVWEVMAQLGCRLFFLVMDAGTTSTVEEMVKAHSDPLSYGDKVKISQKEVGRLVEMFFTSIRWSARCSLECSRRPNGGFNAHRSMRHASCCHADTDS